MGAQRVAAIADAGPVIHLYEIGQLKFLNLFSEKRGAGSIAAMLTLSPAAHASISTAYRCASCSAITAARRAFSTTKTVQADTYLLLCHRYVELNPVRAGMLADPALYRWSIDRANVLGEADVLLTPY